LAGTRKSIAPASLPAAADIWLQQIMGLCLLQQIFGCSRYLAAADKWLVQENLSRQPLYLLQPNLAAPTNLPCQIITLPHSFNS
jgi:hypothetical protein